MKAEVVVAELEALVKSVGASVSYEALRSSFGVGGLCRVKGEYRVIIEKRAGVNERIAALAAALAELDTTALQMSAPVRDLIGRYESKVRPVKSGHSGAAMRSAS